MYKDNKYTKWYNALIAKAQLRNLTTSKQAKAALGYAERHHIIPKSLGGLNEKTNLVYLTAHEHFVAHHLLTKMTDSDKMHFAFWRFVNSKNTNRGEHYTVTARCYASAKEKHALALSSLRTGAKHSEEFKRDKSEKMSGAGNPMFNKKHSESSLNKIRAARAVQDMSHLHNPRTQEWKDKISATLTGRVPTAERNAKVSKALTGRTRPPRTPEWIAAQKLTIAQNRKCCEHCAKNVSKSSYTRYHGDKCNKLR